MFTLYSDHMEISPKIMHNNTAQRSRPHRPQCKNRTTDMLIFRKEMLLCMTFQLASAWPTATSVQSKWSITNRPMPQKLLCPSQMYTDNLRQERKLPSMLNKGIIYHKIRYCTLITLLVLCMCIFSNLIS